MFHNIHDTIPSPPPIDTLPPDSFHNNPLPEITEVDNPITEVDNQIPEPEFPEQSVSTIEKPNTNMPLCMLIISAIATLSSLFYCCQ